MSPPGRQRVFLHVGVPNSGASVVQAALSHHRSALLDAGFLYPDKSELLFHAALDVRGNHKEWGRRRGEVERAWDRLCLEARQHQGTTIISNELLAAAPKRRVASALSMLGGLETHLIVTTRDPASQDILEVLARWGADLPRENVHVVCCAPATDSPDTLWVRFAEAVALDPNVLPLPCGIATRWVEKIEAAVYRVHGDTGDLVPAPVAAAPRDLEEISQPADVEAAVTVIAEQLLEVDRWGSRTTSIKADKKALTKRKKLKLRLAEALRD